MDGGREGAWVDGRGADVRACARSVQTFELFKREAGVVLRNKPGLIASVVIPATLNLVFACIFFQARRDPAAASAAAHRAPPPCARTRGRWATTPPTTTTRCRTSALSR